MPNSWGPLFSALLAVAALGSCVSAACHVLVWCVVRQRPRRNRSGASVSLLRPLCGVDASLEENLAACSRQSHANLHLVIGVAHLEDEALPAALRFCRQNPSAPTRLSVGEDEHLDNPKVALLEYMSRQCEGEWLVVSDSNVRVGPNYVEDALSHAAPDVGLITHLVAGRGGRSFGAVAENLQLNCFVAPAVCGARFLAGQTCVIGKSMFLRRRALEQIGGFQSAGRFLAEDYVIGKTIAAAGYRVVTAALPVAAWHEGWTFGRFFRRHLRWAVMRRAVSRSAYLAELSMTPGPPWMLLLVLASASPATAASAPWIASALCLEQALQAVTFARMTGQRLPLLAVLINPVREWLTLGIWVLGWFVDTVEWRGKMYRVGEGSLLRPATGAVPAGASR